MLNVWYKSLVILPVYNWLLLKQSFLKNQSQCLVINEGISPQ